MSKLFNNPLMGDFSDINEYEEQLSDLLMQLQLSVPVLATEMTKAEINTMLTEIVEDMLSSTNQKSGPTCYEGVAKETLLH